MEADLDHDGKISFEEFQKMVENTDVSNSMTLGELLCPLSLSLICADHGQTNSERDTRMTVWAFGVPAQ